MRNSVENSAEIRKRKFAVALMCRVVWVSPAVESQCRHREDGLLEESGVGGWQGVHGRRHRVEEIEGTEERG